MTFSLKINNAEDGSVLVLTRDYTGHYGSRIHLDKDLTIDGQGHTLDCLGEGGCFAFFSTTGNIVLKNIRIINGHNDYNNQGGAIHIEGSAQYTLENCIFENNWASYYGGAIYNAIDKPLTIINCTFNGNNADEINGGAIYAAGDVIIMDSIFSSNKAGYNGGAVLSKKSVYVNSSTFNYNTATNSGGAIFADLMICINSNQQNESYNSFFTDNKATNNGGGALYSNSVFLKNAVFKTNRAKFDGGAVYAKYEINCSGCQFESNEAGGSDGGAICVSTNGKTSNIEKSIFKSNSAEGYGGAVACYNELNVSNCTFENNHGGFHGGAIYAHTLNINTNQNSGESFNTFFRKNNVKNDSPNFNKGGAIYTTGKAIIRNVYFGENEAKVDGGAIYTNDDDLYVEHCLFESNRAAGGAYQCEGGAIYAGLEIYIHNSTFKDNYADDYGGAIYAKNVRISPNRESETADTFFINNKAKDNDGGAIYAIDNVYAKNVAFISNTAFVDGGAIYAENNVEVIKSIFESNQATGASVSRCYGGAIHAEKNAIINNCTFKNNHADNRGGAVHASTVTLEGDKNTFEGNSAKDYSGAIYTDTFTNDVSHVSFINNQAEDGGAVYINNENWITFTDCVFINNRASNKGGSIYMDSKYSHINIINNSFIGNSAAEGHSVYTCGYYDEVSENFWNINPTDYNNQLVEWKALSSNVQHTDSNPVAFTLEITEKCYANLTSYIKMSFIHKDGTAATLPVIAEMFTIYCAEGIEIEDKEVSDDGITILFKPSEVGTYELTAYLLGMTGTITINVIDGGAIVPVPLPEDDIIRPDIPQPYIPVPNMTAIKK